MLSKLKSIFSSSSVAQPFTDPSKNPGMELEVNNWEISRFVVEKLIPITGYVPYPLTELMLITAATIYTKPAVVFEWGTHIGKGARVFYEIKKAFNLDYDVHSIDLPEGVEHVENISRDRAQLVKDIHEVELHYGDGVDTAVKLYNQKYQGKTALFFVDGDHEYGTVKRELDTVYAAVGKNLHVLSHDTLFQRPESGYNIGPFKAGEEFLAAHPGEFETRRQELGLPGMTFIFPKH
jgi:cephalosporin hydroxylase